MKPLTVFLVLVLLMLPEARAVVIDTVTGTGNTNAPVGDPGWANLGIRGGGTGIYLGEGWVLTASHVGAGSISLAGITYEAAPGTTVQLTNGVSGKTAYTDLIVFRLATTPAGLGPLTLSSSPPTLDAPVTMIGAGRDRGAFTQWTVDTSSTPWTWTEVSSGGNAAGYKTLESRSMRWGTNSVSDRNLWVPGTLDVFSFVTTFHYTGSSDEAQAVVGDSGGAVFTRNGSAWELGGMMFGVAGYSGQPNAAETPVYGDVTFSADLSFYAPQIMSIIPEPTTAALLVLAAAALAFVQLRRRRVS